MMIVRANGPPHDSTQASLLDQVRDPADRAAWERFESTYRPMILGYCRAIGLQSTDAEDVCQDVMLSLASALRSFRYDRSRGRFRHYLARTVRAAIGRHLRERAATRTVQGQDLIDSLLAQSGDGVDAEFERQWIIQHCRRAMQTLQQVMSARDVEIFRQLLAGSDAAEVARRFELSSAAVRKIKQRLRERLRDIVTQQLMEEDPQRG